MTPFEKITLENQKIMLHALRAICLMVNYGPAQEIQDQMERVHDYLNANQEKT